jgi:hypothetical protein
MTTLTTYLVAALFTLSVALGFVTSRINREDENRRIEEKIRRGESGRDA